MTTFTKSEYTEYEKNVTKWHYATIDTWIYGVKIPAGSHYRNWQTTNFGWIAIQNDGGLPNIIIKV